MGKRWGTESTHFEVRYFPEGIGPEKHWFYAVIGPEEEAPTFESEAIAREWMHGLDPEYYQPEKLAVVRVTEEIL